MRYILIAALILLFAHAGRAQVMVGDFDKRTGGPYPAFQTRWDTSISQAYRKFQTSLNPFYHSVGYSFVMDKLNNSTSLAGGYIQLWGSKMIVPNSTQIQYTLLATDTLQNVAHQYFNYDVNHADGNPYRYYLATVTMVNSGTIYRWRGELLSQ